MPHGRALSFAAKRQECCVSNMTPPQAEKFFSPTFCTLQKVGERSAARRQKDLILLVRGCCLGVLIRGLQNLEAPCEGTFFGTFCGVQKVPQKHARTHKKLPVASFCASETAETGRIANGREQGDHVSRRQESFKRI